MENFNFYSPTEFVFGKDREQDTGLYVKKYGGTKVLLHYGGQSAIRSGLLDRVKQSLSEQSILYVELGGVKPNPRDTLVYEGIELCLKEDIDFLLAVGGGSVIDSAKAIAMGVMYEGDFWDFYSGKHPAFSDIPAQHRDAGQFRGARRTGGGHSAAGRKARCRHRQNRRICAALGGGHFRDLPHSSRGKCVIGNKAAPECI